jgi:hypothetical protein
VSTIIQPILTPLEIDLIMSLVLIAYGMAVECHFTAWYSVVMNVIMTAIFLGSNALPLIVIIILLAYVAIGIVVAKEDVDWLYSVFGTKTFGALTLTACLFSIGLLNYITPFLNRITSFFDIDSVYLISWIVIAIIVNVLGWYFFGRNN